MEQLNMLLIDSPLLDETTPEGYMIRTADKNRPSDAEGWTHACEVLTETMEEKLEFYKDMIGDPECGWDNIFFVCRKCDGTICGTATAKNGKLPELHMVGMAREFMGLGLSRSVCAAAANLMIRQGIRRITLMTDDFRIPAIRTYLSLGFRPWYFMDDMPGRWRHVFDEIGIPYDWYTAWNKDADALIPV